MGILLAQQGVHVRRTLVRAVDPEGHALAGATVVFATAPFMGGDRPSLTETRQTKTDAHGRAHLRIEDNRMWCAWATHDGKLGRLASAVHTQVVPGLPIRFELHPFEAFRVRWLNLQAWRKAVGKLGTRFVVDTTTTKAPTPARVAGVTILRTRRGPNPMDGFVVASLSQPAPTNREAALRLPPLPLHSYYAVLVDEHGGFLSAQYMSPNFHSARMNPGVQKLYERKLFLKRLAIGKPTEVRGRVRDSDDQPIANARILVQPKRGQLHVERRYTTRADGTFSILQAAWRKGQFAPSGIGLTVVARDHKILCRERGPLTLTPTGTPPKIPELDVVLTSGRRLRWRLIGIAQSELRRVTLLLDATVTSGRSGAVRRIPIRVLDDGFLELPSPTRKGSGRFDLTLVRDGTPIPLTHGTGAVPIERTIDLRKLRTVELRVQSAQARGRTSGVVTIGKPGASYGTRYQMGKTGSMRVQLMPGPWTIGFRSPRHGDAFRKFEVAVDEPNRCVLSLSPYRAISGHIQSRAGKPVAHALVLLQCQPPAEASVLLRTLVLGSNGSVRTDANGHFAVLASSRAPTVSLVCSSVAGGRLQRTLAVVQSQRPDPLELVLGVSSRRRW